MTDVLKTANFIHGMGMLSNDDKLIVQYMWLYHLLIRCSLFTDNRVRASAICVQLLVNLMLYKNLFSCKSIIMAHAANQPTKLMCSTVYVIFSIGPN